MPKVRVGNFSISLDGYAAGQVRTSITHSASAVSDCTTGHSEPARSKRCSAKVGRSDGIDERFRRRGLGA
jgi:hypothetical protein